MVPKYRAAEIARHSAERGTGPRSPRSTREHCRPCPGRFDGPGGSATSTAQRCRPPGHRRSAGTGSRYGERGPITTESCWRARTLRHGSAGKGPRRLDGHVRPKGGRGSPRRGGSVQGVRDRGNSRLEKNERILATVAATFPRALQSERPASRGLGESSGSTALVRSSTSGTTRRRSITGTGRSTGVRTGVPGLHRRAGQPRLFRCWPARGTGYAAPDPDGPGVAGNLKPSSTDAPSRTRVQAHPRGSGTTGSWCAPSPCRGERGSSPQAGGGSAKGAWRGFLPGTRQGGEPNPCSPTR